MIYRKIMTPIDDSPASLRALEEAIKIAKFCKAALRIIHIIDLAKFSWGGSGFLQSSEEAQKSIDEAGSLVLAKITNLLKDENISYEAFVLESGGDKIADVLVRDARANQVDLLVMGTHGLTGVMQALMGSVAEGVVREINIPVMLLKVDDNK